MKIKNAKAKIISTIGPATESVDKIVQMIEKGMDVARLNFSHNTHSKYKEIIDNIRNASKKTGKEIAILQDLQGPKIRIGLVENDAVEIKNGGQLIITTEEIPIGNDKIVSTNHKALPSEVKPGMTILLDDGYIILVAEKVTDKEIVCKVQKGGLLKSKKGIVVPGTKSQAPSITEKDIEDLKFGLENGIDLVALSFVRSEKDIIELRAMMKVLGKVLPIIAKIERAEAIESIDNIIQEANGIMVARGDLGLELDAEKVPIVQKEIIRKCRYYGKPVIIATQILESMINNPRPTRAEASDVANAVLDGADALMLSAETSVGSYPIEAVDYMNRIILEAERVEFQSNQFQKDLVFHSSEIFDAIANASTLLAEQIKANGIVALTQNGFTAINIAKYRPKIPIFAFTERIETVRKLAYVWGIESFLFPHTDYKTKIDDVVVFIQKNKIGKTGDKFVVATCTPIASPKSENSIKIIEIP
ncbi:pyruvate kinase [Bacteroidetes/Chlorobi group bacterium Naka2016]|jgi:pyruvate kinase|nr:MAG: pyruvate kinase [Bacteroidetes/Chlorobi group bacterium Naka2016]